MKLKYLTKYLSAIFYCFLFIVYRKNLLRGPGTIEAAA